MSKSICNISNIARSYILPMETRQWLITLFDFGSVKARKAGGCEKGTLCKIYIVNGKNMKGSGYL